MGVHAGHGINYHNVTDVLTIPHLEELNIGHAIISRAVFVGIDRAVRDMLRLMGRL
jgi:pyridoxine 5-phosphate synthase